MEFSDPICGTDLKKKKDLQREAIDLGSYMILTNLQKIVESLTPSPQDIYHFLR
jgi:hypothetical protein